MRSIGWINLKMIGSAFTIRNASDYDDMFIASKEDTQEQIANAEYVYKAVKAYVEKIINAIDANKE